MIKNLLKKLRSLLKRKPNVALDAAAELPVAFFWRTRCGDCGQIVIKTKIKAVIGTPAMAEDVESINGHKKKYKEGQHVECKCGATLYYYEKSFDGKNWTREGF